jgi:hypothetical protein
MTRRLTLLLLTLCLALPASAQNLLGTYPVPIAVGSAGQTAALQAPNEKATVARVMAAHPEIDTKDEATRGRILDYVIAELGGKPWGRKARNKDGSNLNTDVLAYLRADGRFEMYDVISGSSGGASWSGPTKGPTVQGTNGWWAPGVPVPTTPDPGDPPDPVEPPAVEPLLHQQLLVLLQMHALLTSIHEHQEQQLEQQARQAVALETAIVALRLELTKGLRVKF